MRGIAEGMMVRDSEGKKLGTVIEIGAEQFLVEKGLFFPKDYGIRFDEVESVGDGEVRVRFAARELEDRDAARAAQSSEAGRAATAPDLGTGAIAGAAPGMPIESAAALGPEGAAARAGRQGPAETREEVRVPLASEELEASKVERQAGEVRVKKDVVTETRHIDVPVSREEVHVERTPVAGSPPAEPGAFQEKTVSVPVREEEVEIHKRPVVREEVRVGKVRYPAEQRAEAEVRREEARIERDPEAGEDRTRLEPGRDLDPDRDLDPKR